MAKSATSHAALQLHCATPKKLTSGTSGRGRERLQKQEQEDVRASRYRLLDERERAREAREIERIQRELQQQRRPRASTRPKSTRSSLAVSPQRVVEYDEGDTPPPYDAFYRSSTNGSSRKSTFVNQKHDPPSPQWTDGDGDEAEPDSDEGGAVKPALPSDFQMQVLRELQKLKEAQRKDLEAIEKLQREKENAERKAKALEATLRKRTQQSMTAAGHRPPALAFGDLEDGDESAPPIVSPTSPSPPQYEHEPYTYATDKEDDDDVLDYTDSELSPRSSPDRWATMPTPTVNYGSSHPTIQRSKSPVFAKDHRQHTRPGSAHSTHSDSRSSYRVDRRPHSARGSSHRSGDDIDYSESEHSGSHASSRGRSTARSRSDSRAHSLSRARSASREDLRRSCSFYQEKEKAQLEQEAREREAQRRLERAARATPPANLLKRQEEAQRKKREQLQQLEKERYAELSPAKRVRARDVPPTTYVKKDAFASAEEREQARQERLLKRSQELMAQAELPTRMQMAKEQELANTKAMEAASAAATSTRMAASLAMSMAVSVKARRKLQEQLEEEEKRRQLMRPKPVPNFTHLQHQWEKALSVKKSKHKPTEPQGFFSARQRELERLRLKKEERKKKIAEQEELALRQEQERQHALLERTKKAAGTADGPKLTKSDELRKKKVQEAIRQQRRQEAQEKQEQERRELRLKEASRRVAAQVKHGEIKRKGDYAGEFVELTAVESVAKEKAKKQREQFREAVQRNKEKLLAAVATKPSLMERFAIDLKREEHKKNALEAVVKQVFQKNFKDMKGILTEEEEELARDLVAADDAEEESAKDEGAHSHPGGDDEDAVVGGDEDED